MSSVTTNSLNCIIFKGELSWRIRGKDNSRVLCTSSLGLPRIFGWNRRWLPSGSFLGFSSCMDLLNFYSAFLLIPTVGVITSWWMTRNLRSLGESLTTVPKRIWALGVFNSPDPVHLLPNRKSSQWTSSGSESSRLSGTKMDRVFYRVRARMEMSKES